MALLVGEEEYADGSSLRRIIGLSTGTLPFFYIYIFRASTCCILAIIGFLFVLFADYIHSWVTFDAQGPTRPE